MAVFHCSPCHARVGIAAVAIGNATTTQGCSIFAECCHIYDSSPSFPLSSFISISFPSFPSPHCSSCIAPSQYQTLDSEVYPYISSLKLNHSPTWPSSSYSTHWEATARLWYCKGSLSGYSCSFCGTIPSNWFRLSAMISGRGGDWLYRSLLLAGRTSIVIRGIITMWDACMILFLRCYCCYACIYNLY